MNEPATCYVSLDEKELRFIIARRAQALALEAKCEVSSDRLHLLNRELLIAILNLGDLEKRRDKPGLSLVIDDEVPL